MRILTWNINSVRLRLPLLKTVMEQCTPDIICLQETKTPDEFFPADAIHDLGYKHIHFTGMKGYNGVAILSKVPFETPEIHARTGNDDCRHIEAKFEHFTLHNLYIPAGGYEADTKHDKFKHKLDFVDELTGWFKDRHDKDENVIAVGDFNIAPLENDVWSHKQLLKEVSHTPAETDRLKAMQDSLNFTDVSRHFIPEEEKVFSWWSYRNKDWKKSNRGRRLDHIWVTPGLTSALKGQSILTEARDWEKPSDHVPVIADLKLAA